jgi:hypothetical protein
VIILTKNRSSPNKFVDGTRTYDKDGRLKPSSTFYF